MNTVPSGVQLPLDWIGTQRHAKYFVPHRNSFGVQASMQHTAELHMVEEMAIVEEASWHNADNKDGPSRHVEMCGLPERER